MDPTPWKSLVPKVRLWERPVKFPRKKKLVAALNNPHDRAVLSQFIEGVIELNKQFNDLIEYLNWAEISFRDEHPGLTQHFSTILDLWQAGELGISLVDLRCAWPPCPNYVLPGRMNEKFCSDRCRKKAYKARAKTTEGRAIKTVKMRIWRKDRDDETKRLPIASWLLFWRNRRDSQWDDEARVMAGG